LQHNLGEIELRTFNPSQQAFFAEPFKAAECAYAWCHAGRDVYFSVNPRQDKGGKKENVAYVVTFHAEIDYGEVGHKKQSKFATYAEVLEHLENFTPTPSLIVHSGGGFHAYWILAQPLAVAEIGVATLEAINQNLTEALGGDKGTQDISRVLRIPGTYNFKLPNHPREVKLVSQSERRYALPDFEHFLPQPEAEKSVPKIPEPARSTDPAILMDIDQLPVSDKIKNLIKHGNDGTYSSRSEADMAVVLALRQALLRKENIKYIFSNYAIGEKYRTHPKRDSYLRHTLAKANEMLNLTEAERQDPLFLSGSLTKTDKNYHLKIVPFQEYIFRKHRLKVLEQERQFYQFNGKCYVECSEERINKICQTELQDKRRLFTQAKLQELIHYAIGSGDLMDSAQARAAQLRYLTLENGLYDLDAEKLVPHTPEVFTSNCLPYKYDPEADCPLFREFLRKVFMGNQETMIFTQEAIGYAFHKALPTPAIFFLIGEGSNGKSVLINTMTELFGENNVCNLGFNHLFHEYYILQLCGKMINISSESPSKKVIATDIINPLYS
jgi:hypothetical protein